jgi:1-acyl-sn-glycerol-3-phosphate acyltransferase
VGHRSIGPEYRLAVTVLRPLLTGFTRRDWRGAEHLPTDGGFVVAVNHISHLDAFTVGHFLYDNGHLPRYLTKESIFGVPLIGRVVAGAGQIPVARQSADAATSYDAAVDAVRRGECVVIYPEATLTRDPGLWPMRGKTGAARVALATGHPVLPIAQWGVQEILAPYATLPHLLPRHTSHVWAGPAVDLGRFAGRPVDGDVLAEATESVMDAITGLLARIRRQSPPEHRWDPEAGGVPRVGNPRPRRRRGAGR